MARSTREERLEVQSKLPVGTEIGVTDDGTPIYSGGYSPEESELLTRAGKWWKKKEKERRYGELMDRSRSAYAGALQGQLPESARERAEREKAAAFEKEMAAQGIRSTLLDMQTTLQNQGEITKSQAQVYSTQLFGKILDYKASTGQTRKDFKVEVLRAAVSQYDGAKKKWEYDKKEGYIDKRKEYADSAPFQNNLTEILGLKRAYDNAAILQKPAAAKNLRKAVIAQMSDLDDEKKALYVDLIREGEADLDIPRQLGMYQMRENEYGDLEIARDKDGRPLAKGTIELTKEKTSDVPSRVVTGLNSVLVSADGARAKLRRIDDEAVQAFEKATKEYDEEVTRAAPPGFRSEFDADLAKLRSVVDTLGLPTGSERSVRERDVGGLGRPDLLTSKEERQGYLDRRYGEGEVTIDDQGIVRWGDSEEGAFPFTDIPGDDDDPATLPWDRYVGFVKGQQAATQDASLAEAITDVEGLIERTRAGTNTPEDEKTRAYIIANEGFQRRYAELYGTPNFDKDRAWKHFTGQLDFAIRKDKRLSGLRESQNILDNPEQHSAASVAAEVIKKKTTEAVDQLARKTPSNTAVAETAKDAEVTEDAAGLDVAKQNLQQEKAAKRAVRKELRAAKEMRRQQKKAAKIEEKTKKQQEKIEKLEERKKKIEEGQRS